MRRRECCGGPLLSRAVRAAGLTTVPLGQYVLASWAGMLPGTAAYVYLGSAGKETLAAASTGDGMPPLQTALYGTHPHGKRPRQLQSAPVPESHDLWCCCVVFCFVSTCAYRPVASVESAHMQAC